MIRKLASKSLNASATRRAGSDDSINCRESTKNVRTDGQVDDRALSWTFSSSYVTWSVLRLGTRIVARGAHLEDESLEFVRDDFGGDALRRRLRA